ncbi:protein tyrosine kinase [Oesophagostomum dentatum]|uniref:non-specific protein-tyrosine kinase n=1 Tax=Oesophagostomum dentatum TaxID=61180 RepID=A0A0B1TPL8_OESDE|nr:protein tyrosine kinase [Oesophagostomum dentatum]
MLERSGKTRGLATSRLDRPRERELSEKSIDERSKKGKSCMVQPRMKVSKPTLEELLDVLVRTTKPIPPSGVVLRTPYPRPDYYFLHEHITILKKLGHGEFGEVNLGKLRLKNGEEIEVAVKMIRGSKVKKSQLSAFFEEAKLMRRFNHPNIVRFFGVATQEEPIMIILEFASGGSLKSYCKNHTDIPPWRLLQFATDGARGMCYLAAQQVIHRDLAARNCLLGQHDELKISDFGLSIADRTEMKLDKLKKLPIKWLAPETLREVSITASCKI